MFQRGVGWARSLFACLRAGALGVTISCSFILISALTGAVTESRVLRLIAGLFAGLILPLVLRAWARRRIGWGRQGEGRRGIGRPGIGRLWFVVSWNLALLLAICLPFSDSAGRALRQRGDWFLGARRGALARGLRSSVSRAGRLLECLDAQPGAGRCAEQGGDGFELDGAPPRRDNHPATDPSGRALELPDDGRFDALFARLTALEQGQARRLRVTIIGDSHMAARVLPRRLERRLQRRFGDGGPGYMHRGKAWPTAAPLEGARALRDGAGGNDARRVGVIVDTLALDGARASTVLGWDEQAMTAHLRGLGPDLIVVALGSNDLGGKAATWRGWVTSSYERLLRRLQRATPSASCLLLGPPDQARHRQGRGWVTPGRLAVVEAIQRRLALQQGCAFWSQRAAMGGPGSIIDWARRDPPLAQQDHLHLTARGYRLMADRLHGALMAAHRPLDPHPRRTPRRSPHRRGSMASRR